MKHDDALLVECLMELGRVEFVEQVLVDERKKYRDKLNVLGMTEGKRIYINPLHHKRRVQVVHTLLHEAVHRVRPRWKERSVLAADGRLLNMLNDEQVEAIHKVYRQAVKRLKGAREC